MPTVIPQILLNYAEARDRLGVSHAYVRRLENRLIHENMGLVHKCSIGFTEGWNATEIEDLKQEGCKGLLKALRRYNPEMGHAFSSLAVPTIKGEMSHWVRSRRSGSGDLKVTRTWYDAWAAVNSTARKLGRLLPEVDLDLVALCFGKTRGVFRFDRELYDRTIEYCVEHSPMSPPAVIAEYLRDEAQSYLFSEPEWQELKQVMSSTPVLQIDECLVGELISEDERSWLVNVFGRLDFTTAEVLNLIYVERPQDVDIDTHIASVARKLDRSIEEIKGRAAIGLQCVREELERLSA